MNAKFTFLIVLGLLTQVAKAQRHDANWVVSSGLTGFTNSIIHFDSNSVQTYLTNGNIPLAHDNANISDEHGNLLFITNGLEIYDSTLNLVPGGQLIQNQWTLPYITTGLNCPQQSIFLPYPGDSTKYILFYTTKEYVMPFSAPGFIPYPLPLHLYYTVLDKQLNNGLGGIVSANNIAYTDTLSQFGSGLAVVKHANGRDWWILIKKHYRNIYHKFLLTPLGVSYQGSQAIGPNNQYYTGTISNFSPDGTIYGESRGNYDIFLFHFDRRNGQLSDPLHLYAPDPSGIAGCEQINFSGNSRYLYASVVLYLTQFDLINYAVPGAVQNSAILVDSVDTFYCPATGGYSYISNGRLALNNKIYYSSNQACEYFTTMDYPDSAGVSCNVQNHNFLLPSPNGVSVPYFANYRLGPVIGSICDSITSVNNELVSGNFIVYPNPAHDYIKIELTNDYSDLIFSLRNMQGSLIKKELFSYGRNFTMQLPPNLNPGIYVIQINSKNGVACKKVVVR